MKPNQIRALPREDEAARRFHHGGHDRRFDNSRRRYALQGNRRSNCRA
jgi:hypothetical protein